MKRFAVATAVFILVVSFSVSMSVMLTRNLEKIEKLATQLEQQLEDGEDGAAKDSARELCSLWHSRRTLFFALVKHCDMAELERCINELELYEKEDKVSDEQELVGELLSCVRSLVDSNRVSIANLLQCKKIRNTQCACAYNNV